MAGNRRILELIAAGKISAREGNSLLQKMEKGEKPDDRLTSSNLVIEINADNEEKPRFRIVIPMKLIGAGMQVVPHDNRIEIGVGNRNLTLNAIDWAEIFRQALTIRSGEIFNLEYFNPGNERMSLQIRVE